MENVKDKNGEPSALMSEHCCVGDMTRDRLREAAEESIKRADRLKFEERR
jgi:hypothetical protein